MLRDSNFFRGIDADVNLAVLNTFWPMTSRSRLVHGCIHGPCLSPGSWLILHGSLSTQFLQGLAD